MFGIGFWELIIILLVALVLFGPQKLPEFARKLGQLAAQLKRAAKDFENSIEQSIKESDAKDEVEKKKLEAELPSNEDTKK